MPPASRTGRPRGEPKPSIPSGGALGNTPRSARIDHARRNLGRTVSGGGSASLGESRGADELLPSVDAEPDAEAGMGVEGRVGARVGARVVDEEVGAAEGKDGVLGAEDGGNDGDAEGGADQSKELTTKGQKRKKDKDDETPRGRKCVRIEADAENIPDGDAGDDDQVPKQKKPRAGPSKWKDAQKKEASNRKSAETSKANTAAKEANIDEDEEAQQVAKPKKPTARLSKAEADKKAETIRKRAETRRANQEKRRLEEEKQRKEEGIRSQYEEDDDDDEEGENEAQENEFVASMHVMRNTAVVLIDSMRDMRKAAIAFKEALTRGIDEAVKDIAGRRSVRISGGKGGMSDGLEMVAPKRRCKWDESQKKCRHKAYQGGEPGCSSTLSKSNPVVDCTFDGCQKPKFCLNCKNGTNPNKPGDKWKGWWTSQGLWFCCEECSRNYEEAQQEIAYLEMEGEKSDDEGNLNKEEKGDKGKKRQEETSRENKDEGNEGQENKGQEKEVQENENMDHEGQENMSQENEDQETEDLDDEDLDNEDQENEDQENEDQEDEDEEKQDTEEEDQNTNNQAKASSNPKTNLPKPPPKHKARPPRKPP